MSGEQYDLSAVRLQLHSLGYTPIPDHGKLPGIKGWNASDYVKREILFRGDPVARLKSWLKRFPGARTTGVRIENGLVVIDIDCDDEAMAQALLAALQRIAPEVWRQAPIRYASGSWKLAIFARLEGKPFVRIGTRKYRRPDDPPNAYHAIEAFGGKPLKSGKCSRQFAIDGPRSYADDGAVESSYLWMDDTPPLFEVALADLPAITEDQIWELFTAFDVQAEAMGWSRVEAKDEGHGEGDDIFDIDPETMRFDVFNGLQQVSYDELEILVFTETDLRVSPNFMADEQSESHDRCSVFWSNRFDCVMVKDWKSNSRHYPLDKAPVDQKDFGAKLQALADKLGVKMTPGWSKRVVDEVETLEAGVITQDGVARVFVQRYASVLRFCHHTGAWFNWTGTHWRKDETALAFYFCRLLGREVTQLSTKTETKEVRKITFSGGVEKYARTDVAVAVTSADWDQDPYLLATPGGTVDLRTGKLRAADPADGITKITAVTPAETADCPRWIKFLNETFGGAQDTIQFVQQWCGYCLTGDITEHALVFGCGSGGNGKSTLLETITGIMQDYAVTAPMETFVATRWSAHPTELAMLRGARMVTASETEEGRSWAESRIKQITGGDKITARFMHKDFFTYMPSFKITIIGNHKPTLHSIDDAIKRRFNLLPFLLKPAKPDLLLGQTLRKEWPGILRWMIEGCLDWQQHGLSQPQSVADATTTYFKDQDLIGQWLEDCCEIAIGNRRWWAPSSQLFASWSEFARRAGESAGSNKAFATELGRRGFEKGEQGDANVRVRYGIRLKGALRVVAGTDVDGGPEKG